MLRNIMKIFNMLTSRKEKAHNDKRTFTHSESVLILNEIRDILKKMYAVNISITQEKKLELDPYDAVDEKPNFENPYMQDALQKIRTVLWGKTITSDATVYTALKAYYALLALSPQIKEKILQCLNEIRNNYIKNDNFSDTVNIEALDEIIDHLSLKLYWSQLPHHSHISH